MSVVNRAPDLFAEFREHERRLRVLENSNRLTSASLKGGTLTVLDASGNVVGKLGVLANGATGFQAFAPGGSGHAELGVFEDIPSGQPQIIIRDGQGNACVALNNQQAGLGHPYLTAALYPITQTVTASTSFVTLFAARVHMQAAAIMLDFYGLADSASTGAARLLVNGVQLGSTMVLPTNTDNEYTIGPAVVPGWTFDSEVYVELQVQRTAGTGNVGASPLLLLNREAP